MDQIDKLTKAIEEQKQALIQAHREIDICQKLRDMYKATVDQINDKFGGITAVDDAIRNAKCKEDAVGGLLTKLEFILVSSM